MRMEGIIIISCIFAYLLMKFIEHGGFVGLWKAIKGGWGSFLDGLGTLLLIGTFCLVVRMILLYPQPLNTLF